MVHLKNIISIAFLLCMSHVIASSLPVMLDSSTGLLNEREDRLLGQIYMKNLSSEVEIITDPLLSSYIKNLGKRLVAASPSPQRHFEFFIVNEPVINAFAGPYGYIAIYSGLINVAETEGEIAAVLSHEIAHVTQHHIYRSMNTMKNINMATVAGILAATAISTQNPQIGAGATAALMANQAETVLKYSREYEKEADRIGMNILKKAGYDPREMVNFFKKMQKNTYSGFTIPELLRSHPLDESRIADMLNRLQHEKSSIVSPDEGFAVMKARLDVLTSSKPQVTLGYYQRLARKYPNNQAYAYGYALSLLENDEYTKANKYLQGIQTNGKNKLILDLLTAKIFLEKGETKTAKQLLSVLREQYPDNFPIFYDYLELLLANGESKEARLVALRYFRRHPYQEKPYNLLSRVYSEAGYPVEAYFIRAEYYERNSEFQLALDQFEYALKLGGVNADTVARIKAKKHELAEKLSLQH